MANLQLTQVAKRLVEADGYIELGMLRHAMACLDRVPEAGPFEAAAKYLRERAEGAAAPNPTAVAVADELDSDANRPGLWLEMSECYRQAGYTSQAVNSLGKARGANSDQPKT